MRSLACAMPAFGQESLKTHWCRPNAFGGGAGAAALMTATALLDADEWYLPALERCPPLLLWPLVVATQTADAGLDDGQGFRKLGDIHM